MKVEWDGPIYVDNADEWNAYITVGSTRVWAGRVIHPDDTRRPGEYMVDVWSPDHWAPLCEQPVAFEATFPTLGDARGAVERHIPATWTPR